MLVVPENQAIRRFSKQYEQINGYYNQPAVSGYSCRVRTGAGCGQGGRFSPHPNPLPRGARGPYCANIVTPATNRLIQPLTLSGRWLGRFRPCRIFSRTVTIFSPQQLFGSVGPSLFQGEGDRQFSSCRIFSSTVSSLQSISLFQKRSTVQPCDSSQLVRTES